ncbi:MAG: hypothetical protein EBQ99_03925 [Planctomycetes bacterium]|nr:hypothetical protein [Planctomycetota bacterium]
MQCNIDRRGRTARIVTGTLVEAVGMGLLAWWFLGGPPWTIWPALGCIAGGNFAIIEGAIGWCAVRAMGFRTPL